MISMPMFYRSEVMDRHRREKEERKSEKIYLSFQSLVGILNLCDNVKYSRDSTFCCRCLKMRSISPKSGYNNAWKV